MKIEIEATEQITKFNGVACRVWKGKTERGTEVTVFVLALRAPTEHSAEFDQELEQTMPPSVPIDIRFVI